MKPSACNRSTPSQPDDDSVACTQHDGAEKGRHNGGPERTHLVKPAADSETARRRRASPLFAFIARAFASSASSILTSAYDSVTRAERLLQHRAIMVSFGRYGRSKVGNSRRIGRTRQSSNDIASSVSAVGFFFFLGIAVLLTLGALDLLLSSRWGFARLNLI